MTAPLGSPSGRLRVTTVGGLGNRLRLLVSGLALAESTGRRFDMPWMRTRDCAASFRELFENDWPVHEALPDEVAALPQLELARMRRLLAADVASQPDIGFRWGGWLHELLPDAQRARQTRRAAELLEQLVPVHAVGTRIERFAGRQFAARMIGVHLRRGDMWRMRPDVTGNTRPAMQAVDRLLDRLPDAGILLCSDDGAVDQHDGGRRCEGLHALFRARYGARVVWTEPGCLDRRRPEAIQDALADLWLLRRTDALVGTRHSSFSEVAAFGRSIPVRLCAGPDVDGAGRSLGGAWAGIARSLALVGGAEPGPLQAMVLVDGLRRRLWNGAADRVIPGHRQRRQRAVVDDQTLPVPATTEPGRHDR